MCAVGENMTFKRKEIIGDCVLYLGDCLNVMPTLKYDSIVSDPPYGTQDLGGGYGRRQLHSENGKDGRVIENDFDLSALESMLKLLNGEYFALVFYAPRKTKEFIKAIGNIEYVGEIIWNKKQMGLGYTIRYAHESIAVLKIGKNPRPLFPMQSVISCHQLEKLHPHQKPIELMEILCSWQSGIILDPFMGSGSTGVACVNLGRSFIGIELDEEYFEIACERIRKAYEQPDMFVEMEKQEVKQETLL